MYGYYCKGGELALASTPEWRDFYVRNGYTRIGHKTFVQNLKDVLRLRQFNAGEARFNSNSKCSLDGTHMPPTTMLKRIVDKAQR